METPQHGIGPKKTGNLPKMNIFKAFPVFSKIIGNPSNPIFRGISRFFESFPRFLGRIPVYQGLILLRETDPKKGETDQQTESLKLLLKTGN